MKTYRYRIIRSSGDPILEYFEDASSTPQYIEAQRLDDGGSRLVNTKTGEVLMNSSAFVDAGEELTLERGIYDYEACDATGRIYTFEVPPTSTS